MMASIFFTERLPDTSVFQDCRFVSTLRVGAQVVRPFVLANCVGELSWRIVLANCLGELSWRTAGDTSINRRSVRSSRAGSLTGFHGLPRASSGFLKSRVY